MFPYTARPRSFEAALRDLDDSRAKVRASAARDLARHHEGQASAVVERLQKALDDADEDVRAEAALLLADLKATEAVPALLRLAKAGKQTARQAALAALGELGDKRGLEPVQSALADSHPEMRFQAVIAFPRICDDRDEAVRALLEATRDDDPRICHIALRMAEELGPEADATEGAVVPRPLLERAEELLRDPPSDPVQLAGAIILARSGQKTKAVAQVLVKAATRALRTDQADDEATAIELCGRLGLEQAVPELHRRAFGTLLGWSTDAFAWQARVALAALGHPRAVRWVERELRSWNRERRSLAVAAAGQGGVVAARKSIEAMRGQPERADQNAVKQALAALDELEKGEKST